VIKEKICNIPLIFKDDGIKIIQKIIKKSIKDDYRGALRFFDVQLSQSTNTDNSNHKALSLDVTGIIIDASTKVSYTKHSHMTLESLKSIGEILDLPFSRGLERNFYYKDKIEKNKVRH